MKREMGTKAVVVGFAASFAGFAVATAAFLGGRRSS